MPKKLTVEAAQEVLNRATTRNIQITSWGGSTRKLSTFLDVERNFSFEKPLREVLIGFRAAPNRKFGASKEEHADAVSASKVKTQEEAQALLPEHLQIVKYAGRVCASSTIYNKLTGVTRDYSLTDLFSSIKDSNRPKYNYPKLPGLTSQEALEKLKENYPNRDYEILSWGGTASAISTFFDKQFNFEFSCSYDYLRDKLKENSERLLGAPKELVIAERLKTRQIKNLDYPLFQGKSPSDWAKELGCSYSFVQNVFMHKNYSVLENYSSNKTSIEIIIGDLLNELNIKHISNKYLEDTSYRPDFVIPDHKLIIECDGLYWHSDANQTDSNYHVAKKAAYTNLGYTSVFFRENEINQKLPIVKSMLLARLGLCAEKHMARKLCVLPGSQDFMERNHLMGTGSGRRYSLYHESSEVAQMQVKWVDKSSRTLEISRFATNGSILSGGFSKLLKHIEAEEQPKFVKTFIDLRYGEGKYLPSLGFTHAGTHKSFVWTKGNEVHHRMKFSGNTGYEFGYNKLWDCGQAKYVKEVI